MGSKQPYDEAEHWTCIRCGLCLESCPTYRLTRQEGLSPRGRISIVRALAADPDLGAQGLHLIEQCCYCRACEAACPSGVPFGGVIASVRAWLAEGRLSRRTHFWRTALRRLGPCPRLSRLVLRLVRLGCRLRAVQLGVRLFAHRRHRLHYLAMATSLGGASPPAPLQWPNPAASPAVSAPPPGERTPSVLLFTGCVTRALYPKTSAALLSVLSKLGMTWETPRRQFCCGMAYRQVGLLEDARELARRNIDAFEAAGGGIILADAGGCAASLREYALLLREDAEYAERAQRFSARVQDATDFITARLRPAAAGRPPSPPAAAAGGEPQMVVQTPCHQQHVQGLAGVLPSLLDRLGLACRPPPPEGDLCCGGAGLHGLLQPAASHALGERKADLLAAGGAPIVVTADPGCRIQLQGRLARRGIRLLHILEVCDHLLPGPDRPDSP